MSLPFGSMLGAKLKLHLGLLVMIPLAILLGVFPYYATVFIVVFIHELAHSIAARCLKVDVHEIELAPFGGVARMGVELETMPGREIIIALAGPASNLLMAMLALLIDYIYPLPPEYLAAFLSINFMLGAFNLLPALPLDGGRVARAILSFPLGIKTATRVVSIIGCVLGVGILVLAVVTAIGGTANLTFFISGLVLLVMAWREGRQATVMLLRDITARQHALLRDGALSVRQMVVSKDMRVGDVARRMSPRRYHQVVLLNERMEECGVLAEGEILRAMLSQQSTLPVGMLLSGKR